MALDAHNMAKTTGKRTTGTRKHRLSQILSGWLDALRQLFLSFYRHQLKAIYRRINGYHFGVLCCAWTSGIVLILNVLVTIWAGSSFGIEGGLGTLQDGSCKRSSSLGFWIHLIINILSTALLGASNYTMQCLSSPTRAEIDKAHREGSWLDIGVPSFGNLWKIATHRKALWWSLALSTIPLHLLWNSAVFVSLSSREYNVWVVPFDFPEVYNFDYADHSVNLNDTTQLPLLPNSDADAWSGQYETPQHITQNISQMFRANVTKFELLDIHDCLKRYIGPVISDRADVLLVSSQNSTQSVTTNLGTSLHVRFQFYSYTALGGAGAWMCDVQHGPTTMTCNLKSAASNMASSYLQHWDVSYCWSQRVEEHCKLQFSPVIMIIVIICNLIKLISMAWVAWKQDCEPLVTLGDAIASFLDCEDTTSRRLCLAGENRFRDEKARFTNSDTHNPIIMTFSLTAGGYNK